LGLLKIWPVVDLSCWNIANNLKILSSWILTTNQGYQELKFSINIYNSISKKYAKKIRCIFNEKNCKKNVKYVLLLRQKWFRLIWRWGAVVGFELRALCLLVNFSTTWATPSALCVCVCVCVCMCVRARVCVCVLSTFEVGSLELFVQADFEPQSSWSLPLA
jgi:hypothetical protein